jgi:hypothetical protein
MQEQIRWEKRALKEDEAELEGTAIDVFERGRDLAMMDEQKNSRAFLALLGEIKRPEARQRALSRINLQETSRALEKMLTQEKQKQKLVEQKQEQQKRSARRERDEVLAKMEQERVKKRSLLVAKQHHAQQHHHLERSRSEPLLRQPPPDPTGISSPPSVFKLAPLAQYFAHLKRRGAPPKKRCELPMAPQVPQLLDFRTDARFLRRAHTFSAASASHSNSAPTSPEAKAEAQTEARGAASLPRHTASRVSVSSYAPARPSGAKGLVPHLVVPAPAAVSEVRRWVEELGGVQRG